MDVQQQPAVLSAAPVPVQPLSYSTPQAGRPGVLTAVAVLSIIFGSLGAVSALSSIVGAAMMGAMSSVAPATPAPAPAGGAPGGANVTVFNTGPGLASIVLQVIEATLRLGLAALLIVAAIFVFRDHRLGRKLHLIWAWVKIPAAVVGALLSWQVMVSMFGAMPAGPPGFTTWMVIAMVLVNLIIACAYPVAVLIVMQTRTVRNYYEAKFGGSVG